MIKESKNAYFENVPCVKYIKELEGGQDGCRGTCQEAKVVHQETEDGGLD